MSIEHLFKPGKIGKLETKNRIFMAPMATNFATADGSVTKDLLDYYEARAKGGVGLIITGTIHAEKEIACGSLTGTNLRIDHHKYIAGLSELADSVHFHGAKIFGQLTIGQGSFSSPDLYPPRTQPIAPSPIKTMYPGWVARALTVDEIERIVAAYGKAALRVRMAGFDGIEIHGHARYLLAQFMSPFTNKRTDKYGDPIALPLALVKSVKDNVGDDFPISFRCNIDEFLEGGRDLERSKKEVKLLEEAGIHAIHVSGGNFWVPEGAVHSVPPVSFPQGYLRPQAKAIKDTVSIAVMLTSKFGDPTLAGQILQDGQADFIGMARSFLAEPEWPNKVAEGRLDEICPCIRDQEGCINRLRSCKKIRCTVNAVCGREGRYKIELTKKPRKVMVVGGGVGGMEAARVAALRGHEVTLYEKSDRLGGRVRLAGMIPYKGDINLLTQYLATQVNKLGIRVKLGQEVTSEMVMAMQPEALIVATGANPLVPEIPGVDRSNVFIADDVIAETVEVAGDKIVIAGGGFVGLDTALFLAAKKRKRVTIIEQLTFQALGFVPYDTNYMDLMKKLTENKVEIMTETKIEEITDKGVRVIDKKGERHDIEADSVVLAVGAAAEKRLFETLRGKIPEVYAIGDCQQPGKIINAIHEGFHVAFGL